MKKEKFLKNNYKWLTIFVNLILLGFIILCIAQAKQDKYEISFLSNALLSEQEGLIKSEELPMSMGNYNIHLNYQTDSDQNYMIIYSAFSATSDNKKGVQTGEKIYLKKEQNSMLTSFSLQEDYQDIQIMFYHGEGNLVIEQLDIESEGVYYQDWIWGFVLLVILEMFINFSIFRKYFFKTNFLFRDWQYILIIVLSVFIVSLPFFSKGLIRGHDIRFHLARIEGIYQNLKQGNFPIRINTWQGYTYGYPSPVFYPETFFYFPALLRLLHISLAASYKVFMVGINAATIMISFFSFKKLFSNKRLAIIISVIYLFSPYRLINMYERAAVGETLAMIFFPLIIWGLYEIFFRDHSKWIYAALGYWGSISSHIISTELCLIFSVIFGVLFFRRLCKQYKRGVALLKAASVSLLLKLWFIIPFLSYQNLDIVVQHTKNGIHASGIYLSQLFTTTWANGTLGIGSLGYTKGEMPQTVGMLCLLCLLFFVVYRPKIKEQDKNIAVFSCIFGSIILVMSTNLFPWEWLQNISWIDKMISPLQLAVRFLAIATVFLCIVEGIVIDWIWGKRTKLESQVYQRIFLFFLVVILNSGSLILGTFQMERIDKKSYVEGTNQTDQLYLFQGVDSRGWKDRGNVISGNFEFQIDNYSKKGNKLQFTLIPLSETGTDSYLEFPIAFYPNYMVRINGQEIAGEYGNNGVVRAKTSQIRDSGVWNIQLYYKEPVIWLIGAAISGLTYIVLIGEGLKKNAKTK